MVRAWYMDSSSEGQRLPHMTDPPNMLDIDMVKARTGLLYYKIDADGYTEDKTLEEIRRTRGYSYEDVITLTENVENYEALLKKFYVEHIHADEEIRLVVDGSGYFDVRDVDNNWIRIEAVKGDLIILPAGIYHRFTLDQKDYIKAARYFVGSPVWTSFNRPAEDHPARLQYLKQNVK